jgi:hypothetical protein
MRNRRLTAVLAALFALTLSATAHAETATVGMTTFVSDSPAPAALGQNIPVFQGAAGSNYVLAAPKSGTITSWSFLSGGVAPGRQFALRVLRPSGSAFTAVATSGPAAVSSPALSDIVQGPFVTSLPVHAGDRIALQAINDADVPIEQGAAGVDGIRYFLAGFADGASATPFTTDNNAQIVPVRATIEVAAPAPPGNPPPGNPPAAPAPVAPQNQVPPSITGTPAAGQTLTCDPGSWGGDAPITYTETWTQRTLQRVARPHAKVTTIHVTKQLGTGATITVADLAPDTTTISCTVTAQNSAGTVTATTVPTVTVQATAPEIASRFVIARFFVQRPEITLNAAARSIATCSTGAWLHFPTKYRFDWYAGRKSPTKAPAAGKRIVSHRATYRLRAIDAKRWLTCRVIAYNAAGHGISFSTQDKAHA